MAKKRKMKYNRTVTLALFAAALILLGGSVVGTTRAALMTSENWNGMLDVSKIGVSLMENGTAVSNRDYTGTDWVGTVHGKLLEKLLPADATSIQVGVKYKEEIAVKNSGSISQYVRVTLYKHWSKNNAVFKSDELTPDLINLELATNNGWVLDKEATTNEQMVFYYSKLLAPGETTPPLTKTIQVDPSVAMMVDKTPEQTFGNETIWSTVFRYNGVRVGLEAEVDAVQDHHADDAIKSAWGRDVKISGTELSLDGNDNTFNPGYIEVPDDEEEEERPVDPGYRPGDDEYTGGEEYTGDEEYTGGEEYTGDGETGGGSNSETGGESDSETGGETGGGSDSETGGGNEGGSGSREPDRVETGMGGTESGVGI